MLQKVSHFLTFRTENRPVLGIICLLIVLVILIAGLWPLNFNPSNKVEWLKNEDGIRFYDQGMVISQDPFVTPQTVQGSGSITAELLIRPFKERRDMVASILTFYNYNQEQFILGQWKSALIIRIPAPNASSLRRYREIGIEHVLQKNITHLIAVSSGKESTAVYVDGKLAKNFPHFSISQPGQTPPAYLVLGNSPKGTNSWNGILSGLAIYSHALSSKEVRDHYLAWRKSDHPPSSGNNDLLALYVFDEHDGKRIIDHSSAHNDLLIPASFHPLHRIILGLPEQDQWFNQWNLTDIALNILGFIPFGFFLSAWLRQAKNLPTAHAYGIIILIGFFLSLAIELAQAYLPTRDSSLLDVINNTLGTALGTLLMEGASPILYKANTKSA